MSDVFNIENRIEKLESEVKSLKTESKYLRKKALITPLIVLYNHVRDENLKSDQPPFSLTIVTKNRKSITFKEEQVIATNDEIERHTETGWKHYCNINDIKEITFDNKSGGKHDYFTNKFD
ncbi:hypothetical protein ACFL4H_02020 [Candidatus Neomarinimicrobiota bacterium]